MRHRITEPKHRYLPVTTATISAAAQALAKEAAETPTQTAQEAQGNDRQAQRLLAKEVAARKAYSWFSAFVARRTSTLSQQQGPIKIQSDRHD